MTPLPSEPQPARIEDQPAIVSLIQLAAGWLATKGTDQWAQPWPTAPARNERIADGLRAGMTWMVWDGPTAVATVTSRSDGDPQLWSPNELTEPAVYLHRLVINRKYAGQGIGAALIDWAVDQAAAEHDAWYARIDVWTTNYGLRRYYQELGFEFLRVAGPPDYPSGALLQRKVPTSIRGDASDA